MWIRGNGRGEHWHLGCARELRTEKTKTLMSRYYVAACNGKQLGGPWGYHSQDEKPPGDICRRCITLIVKQQITESNQ